MILKPGEGTSASTARHLDEYFPRVKLQRVARQPLEAAGYNTRMDVVARIHGGGVSAQATLCATASPARWSRPTPPCVASSSAAATSRATRA